MENRFISTIQSSEKAYQSVAGKQVSQKMKYSIIKGESESSSINVIEMLPDTSGTYSDVGTKSVDINLSGAGFLNGKETVLKLPFTNTTATPRTIDRSGHSIISKIQIIAQNNKVIEDIQAYNLCYSTISSLQLDSKFLTSIVGSSEGYNLNNTITLAYNESFTFYLYLMSGFLNSDRLLPIAWFKSVKLHIEFAPAKEFMVNPSNTVVTTATVAAIVTSHDTTLNTASYTITGISLLANVVITNDIYTNAFTASLIDKKVIQWDSTSFIYTNIPINIASKQRINIPIICRSLKSILFFIRDTSNISHSHYRGLTKRFRAGITGYQWFVKNKPYPNASAIDISSTIEGNEVTPNATVASTYTDLIASSIKFRNYSRSIRELQKCFGSICDIDHSTLGNLTEQGYLTDFPINYTAGGTDSNNCMASARIFDEYKNINDYNKFIIGQDFEIFNQDDNLICGLDCSNGETISLELTMENTGQYSSTCVKGSAIVNTFQAEIICICDTRYYLSNNGELSSLI